jgi:glycosyltransferase involved in cell wall biosynthesis
MKILFVADGLLDTDKYPLTNKGASVQTWGISRELAKRGHNVIILRRTNADEGVETVEGVTLVGIKLKGQIMDSTPFVSHFAQIVSSLYFSLKSVKLIQKYKPDCLFLMNRYSGSFPSALKIPTVYIMHSPDALGFFKDYSISANMLNSVLFYFKKSVENTIIQNSGRVIVLNKYIENYLKTSGVTQVERIPNGILVENYKNNGDDSYILYAGRFDWNKNVISLMKVFSEIAFSHPNYQLYLIGEGQQEVLIRALIKEKNLESSVKIYPWLPRTEVLEKISRCSVFVLPSFFEAANPNVILESMSSSKPVIARVNIGTIDIISHNENGFLYNNEAELKKYLELLLLDKKLRKTIGNNARKAIERNYNFPMLAQRYENMLYNLCRLKE